MLWNRNKLFCDINPTCYKISRQVGIWRRRLRDLFSKEKFAKTRQEALMIIQQLQLNVTEIREIPVEDSSQFDRVAAQQYTDGTYTQYEVGQQVMQQTQVTLVVYVSNEPTPAPESAKGAGWQEGNP